LGAIFGKLQLRLKLEEGKDQYEMDLNGMQVIFWSQRCATFPMVIWDLLDPPTCQETLAMGLEAFELVGFLLEVSMGTCLDQL